MKTKLLAVGGRMENWVSEGFDAYARRLPPTLRPELAEIPLAARPAGSDAAGAVAAEGRRLLARVRAGDRVVALDEAGNQYDSLQLAGRLEHWLSGRGALAFVIGGPDGLSAAVRERADELWSLSRLTLPHGLVRVILAEQLYRAWTIRQGHPYHKV